MTERWHRWPLLLLILVGGYSLVNYAYNAVINPAARIGVDFPANYLSAELVSQGKNPFDLAAFNQRAMDYGWQPDRVTPFVYHPLFAGAMIPLLLLSPEGANALWVVLSQAALWGGLALFGLGLARGRAAWLANGQWPAWAVGTALLAANFRPLFTSLQSGRVDVWVLLLTALTFYLLARSRDVWAGLTLGVAILLKITPGFLLMYLVLTRRWRAVVSTLAVCGLLAGMSLLLFGWDTNYTFWAGVLPSLILGPESVPDPSLRSFFDRTVPGYESFAAFIGKLAGFKYHNQALSGLFRSLFDSEYTETIAHSPALAQLFGGLTMALLLAGVGWISWRRLRAGADPAQRARAFDLGFVLVLAVTPLIASVAWEHHFLTDLLAFSLLLAYGLRGERTIPRWLLGLAALAYAGLAVGYSTNVFDVWRKGVWVFALYGRAYAALLVVGVMGYLLLREKEDPVLRRLSCWLRSPTGQWRWGWIAALLLGPLLLVAFSLRLAYAQGSSLYIDEYVTLLAARQITQFGVPRTPSGAYYTPGLLFTYLEAAVQAMAPYDKVLARLPSVLLGTGTVFAIFLAGRRLFGTRAALLAAAFLALDAEAVIWDGRARMYALLHFLVVLAVYFFYKGVVEKRDDRARHLFVAFFLAALFAQMEVALLLPALGLVWLLWQSPRDWLRPAVWFDLGLLGAGVAVRFYLHGLMVLPGLPAPAVPRPFVAPGGDILAGLQALSAFFLAPSRWPAAVLFVIGLAALIVMLARKGWLYLRREKAALASLTIFLLAVWTEMGFVVGESWRRPRYLLLTLPWFLLVAASTADTGLRAAWTWLQAHKPALRRDEVAALGPVAMMAVVVILVGTLLAPHAIRASRTEDFGYDLAFETIRGQWQPGDAVATIVPAASLFFLDRCDYLAIGRGYEGYSLERDGTKVESWGLLPLLQSPDALDAALAQHPRLWLVVDTMRWERNFPPEFRDLVWQRMALVSSERKVLVFRSGPDLPPLSVHLPTQVDFDGRVRLLSTALGSTSLQPGETLPVAFYWQAQVPLAQDYSVFVHVDDAAGRTVVQADAGVTGGLFPMYEWEPGDLIVDRRAVALPTDLPAGWYRLNVGLYEPPAGDRLPVLSGGDGAARQATAAVFWVGERPAASPPAYPMVASFDGQICLEGYDLVRAQGREHQWVAPGETLGVVLHWGACGPVMEDLHTFVHLTASDGTMVAQGDAPPMAGQYPTRFWQPGEVLLDPYEVRVPPGTPPGDYALQVGLYLLATGDRVPVDGGGDALLLATLEVR